MKNKKIGVLICAYNEEKHVRKVVDNCLKKIKRVIVVNDGSKDNTLKELKKTKFKMFLKWRGFELDNSSFELRFNEPQNFSKYREVEMDGTRINTFTSLEGYPYLSKRFLMQRFLGLTEEEMLENTNMWREENVDDQESDMPNMRSVGITPGGIETDLDTFTPPDLDTSDDPADAEATGDEPGAGQADATGTTSPIPGSPAPAEAPTT